MSENETVFPKTFLACDNLACARSLNSKPKSGSLKTSEIVWTINGFSSRKTLLPIFLGIVLVGMLFKLYSARLTL